MWVHATAAEKFSFPSSSAWSTGTLLQELGDREYCQNEPAWKAEQANWMGQS